MTYHSVSPTLADPMPADALELLRSMYEIRFFEDEIMGLFSQNLVRGSTHLCQGQEAVTVGVCSALSPGDTMTCTYRGHGAVLAMGAPLDRAFGEILGRAGGLCGGKGGSMHLADVSVGALGSNAIVGGHLPTTVGAALAASYRGTSEVSVAFFGDGSTNIGAFHESLNLASIWKLPAIFVIENNQYGEYSTVASTTPIDRLSDRAASYGMPGVFVDGNDVIAMRSATKTAVERARAGEGPTLIEADTYRHSGHSRSDPAKYRPEDEVKSWFARDPIVQLRNAIEATGGADAAAAVERTAHADVEAARDLALTWPEPELSAGMEHIYS
ncbi:thiamine pyrophosphate-dependent dehydrogenase E1 component subunit alpha [Rhodoglobus sp.]